MSDAAQSPAEYDVVVVGAGPAGMTAAIYAARVGAAVAVYEKMPEPGMKLLSTGGGRCNLTNNDPPDVFMSRFGRDGRFMADALSFLSRDALLKFLSGLDVATHSTDGFGVYPRSESARTVRDALGKRCGELGVRFKTGSTVESLVIDGGRVQGVVADGSRTRARSVVVAAGGKSHPELGSAGEGFALAKGAGHSVVDAVPALTPLVVAQQWVSKCAGVSVPGARMEIDARGRRAAEAEGDIIFTHRGLSGPAALNISGSVAELLQCSGEIAIEIDLTPALSASPWSALMDNWRADQGSMMLRNAFGSHLPAGLAAALVGECCADADVRVNQVSSEERQALCDAITSLALTVTGTDGFARSMVTRGGVRLKEVDPRTLGSRIVSGLYFAGEVLDLDGPCGGYNLQWAFSSGALAGKSAARSC